MTTVELKEGRGLWQVLPGVLAVFGPLTVITAVFYYFGRARTQSFYDYFGVSLSVLNLPNSTYLAGTTDTVFRPLATILCCAIGALLVHNLLRDRIRAKPAIWRRRATAVLFDVSAVFASIGLLGLYAEFLPVVAAPALAAAVLLFEYAIVTAPPASPRVAALRASAAPLRYGLVIAVVLVALFWAATVAAHQRGKRDAELVEHALLTMPQALVYSENDLHLEGPYVKATPLTGSHTAYRFRYNGLRQLVHANERWFLLPARWRHDNGATVIVVNDDPATVRIDLAPGRGPGR